MHRGPPRPRDSSALGMVWSRMPASSRQRLVTAFRAYTTTSPGAMARVLDPSLHCSRAASISLPEPQGIRVT